LTNNKAALKSIAPLYHIWRYSFGFDE